MDRSHHNLIEQVARALEAGAERLPSLRFAFVFGSVASGTERTDSDIDLAVDLGRRLRFDELGVLVELVSNAAGREVDIVDLQSAGPILQMQVLRNGVAVFERDPKARALFEMHTPSIYEDFRREREPVERALLATRVRS